MGLQKGLDHCTSERNGKKLGDSLRVIKKVSCRRKKINQRKKMRKIPRKGKAKILGGDILHWFVGGGGEQKTTHQGPKVHENLKFFKGEEV